MLVGVCVCAMLDLDLTDCSCYCLLYLLGFIEERSVVVHCVDRGRISCFEYVVFMSGDIYLNLNYGLFQNICTGDISGE